MRILIISLPRTGSSTLTNKYRLNYNLKAIEEPFSEPNDGKYSIEDISKNNLIVKTIIGQIPKNENNEIIFWYNQSLTFDKVILLSRKDLKACIESTSYLYYNAIRGFEYNESYEWHLTPNHEVISKYIYKCESDLNKLSKLLNIDIIYYEDIYDLNSKDRLRLKKFKRTKLL